MNNTGNTNGRPAVSLPGRITSIQPQKNNKNRFSVFIDDQFLTGISGKCLSEFSLKPGVLITPELFERLQRADQLARLEDYFLGLLARRAYARFELQTRAHGKGYGSAVIDVILNDFQEKGWIDDYEFATLYSRDHIRLKNWGPQKITANLISKGITPKIARNAVKTIIEEFNIPEILRQIIQKRKLHFRRESNILKRKKKILDFLVRKGFSSEMIYQYMDELMNEVER